MRSTKNWTIPLLVVFLLQVLVQTLTVVIVLQLDMLPSKYVLLLVGVMGFIALGTGLLFFVKVKGRVSLTRRIITCFLAVLIVCGCAFVSKSIAQVHKTVQSVTGVTLETDGANMYAVVRQDDAAQKLADTKGYTYGAIDSKYDVDIKRTEKMLELVSAEIGGTPNVKKYPDKGALADALLNKEIDVMLINGVTLGLLLEEKDEDETFQAKLRILYSVPCEKLDDKPSTVPDPPDQPDPGKNVTNAPFVVYISGSDARTNTILKSSRSDVNILMIVNPVTKQILLLNTPRDYYIGNPHYGGALDKLTHCGNAGVGNSMLALEELYGVDIPYYGHINFVGFEKLIDDIGGITIYSDQAFTARATKIKKGENYLNGTQALDFSRERYHVNGGDNGRGKNQMKVISAVIKKMTTGTTLITKYSEILSDLEGLVAFNLQSEDISMLVKMQLSDMASWNVQSFAVTGTNGSEETCSMPGDILYVMHPDEKSVAYASELIDRVLAGEKLTEADMKVPE